MSQLKPVSLSLAPRRVVPPGLAMGGWHAVICTFKVVFA